MRFTMLVTGDAAADLLAALTTDLERFGFTVSSRTEETESEEARLRRERKEAYEAAMTAKAPEDKYTAPPDEPAAVTAIKVECIREGVDQAEIGRRVAAYFIAEERV
jgi:hypothetical protein